ncbi:MAG: hypothetical protein B7Z66_14460 [Chromatiales bacterium 21-64-14]|nr:MAG: hypothetical protein B7Z66_14460 [Chromatiales bacterium 21-64-14]
MEGNRGLRDRAVATPPHWANEVIAPFDEEWFHAVEPFIVESYWSGQQSINVFDVVGTSHPDYAGRTWLEFLREGKRMDLNLGLLRENPGYYLEDEPKRPGMYYRAVDDDRWFVAEDGNHRTAIARFLFHESGRSMLHGLTVTKYRTDRRAFDVYTAAAEAIEKSGGKVRLRTRRTKRARADTGGWMRENWKVEFEWTDLRRGGTERLTVDEVERRIEPLSHPSRWRGCLAWLRRAAER